MSKHIKNNGIRGLSVLVSSTINEIYSYINRHLIFYINIVTIKFGLKAIMLTIKNASLTAIVEKPGIV